MTALTPQERLLELAERVEKATCSSNWELNRDICRLDFFREDNGDCADDEVPDFTSSFDDAYRLVPHGAGLNLQGTGAVWYGVVAGTYSKACLSPGSALTAAALRARASLSEGK